jgi:hypothetical protein
LSLMSFGRREGESAERAVGEKCLVKGTFPHIAPVVSRRPLACPASGDFSARSRHQSDVPTVVLRRGRRAVRLAADAAGVDVRADMMSTSRSTTALPQATVGLGGNHPQLAARRLQVRGPIRRAAGSTARHRLRLRCPGPFSPVLGRGNANKAICYTPGAFRRHISL